MNIFLIILFVILVPIAIFCLWVLCKVASNSTNMEEQMEIERKLRESNEERKFKNNKR